MKKRRFTEEEILGILKQAEAGMKVVEICRWVEVSARLHNVHLTAPTAGVLPWSSEYFYRTLNRAEH